MSIFLIFTIIPILLLILTIISQVLNLLTQSTNINADKLSLFECGFNPNDQISLGGVASSKFEISFYLMGILFMVFDIEILFLFPGVMMIVNPINNFGYSIFMIFFMIILIGFVYEWKSGALDMMGSK